MITGYIKLDRKMLLNWKWYTDVNTCKLFFHMMLKSNWRDEAYQGVEVPRGAFVSTYPELAQETGLSVKNVRTALEHLKNTGEVAVSRYSKFSLFTVKNYDVYQNGGSQAAGRRQSDGSQPATIKEKKNKRIKENIYACACACARKGSTGFTNFEQRDYDFDDLEGLILQAQERSSYEN